jgi:hypothetical protein
MPHLGSNRRGEPSRRAPSAAGAADRDGGALPSPALLRFANLGIEITHLYGLTESFGPVVICDWKPGAGRARC